MQFKCEIVAREGHDDLNVDVFEPGDGGNGAPVILVHGGAWMVGDRSAMHAYCERLAAKGFVAIAAQYGLLPAVRWPAPLDDIRDVVRWTKTNANRLNVDSAKIATVGFSAGAHLVMLAAGTADGTGHETALGDGAGASVGAVVSCFGALRIEAKDAAPGTPLELLLDGNGEERARAISPITYAGPGFPPALLLLGAADVLMPVGLVIEMYQALEAAGTDPELHIYPRQNHEFTGLPGMIDALIDEVAFFLQRTLVDPRRFIDEDKALNLFSQPGGVAAALGPRPEG